jgi:hypothetical protein
MALPFQPEAVNLTSSSWRFLISACQSESTFLDVSSTVKGPPSIFLGSTDAAFSNYSLMVLHTML